MWSDGSSREQLDRIWRYLCEMPGLEEDNEDLSDEVNMINERLKLIETILRQRKEQHVRGEMKKHESVIAQFEYTDEDDTNVPDPVLIIKTRNLNKKTTLNIGGERHEVSWRTLESAPHTRLGRLASAENHDQIMECVDLYSLVDNEFFFDRHPRSFLAILNFYRTGKLHVADEMCVMAFNDDLEYWGISDLWLETCCQNKFIARKEFVEDEMKKEAQNLLQREKSVRGGNINTPWTRCQNFLWDLFERPETSIAARIMSYISVLFVVISTVAMILNTMPEFEGPKDSSGHPTDNYILSMLETICIIWFSLEYILRFVGAPHKLDFLKDAMNIVDILAILPYFITLLVTELMYNSEDGGDNFHELRQVVSVFRIMRILRFNINYLHFFNLTILYSGSSSLLVTRLVYNPLPTLSRTVTRSSLSWSSSCPWVSSCSPASSTSQRRTRSQHSLPPYQPHSGGRSSP